jgi:hypothetical protein
MDNLLFAAMAVLLLTFVGVMTTPRSRYRIRRHR